MSKRTPPWGRRIGTVALMSGLVGLTPSARSTAQTTQGAAGARGEVLQRILVKVNGDIITQTDLESRQIGMIRDRGVRPATDTELRRALLDVTPEVISTAIDELLLVQQGRQLGYHLTDEQFDDLVAGIKEENNFTSDDEFAQALLQSEGMTVDDLREVMERQMLINQVQQIEILSKVRLTEVEAREYYDTHLDEFTEPATVTMREILIRVAEGLGGTVNVVADERARAAAEEARERILAGEDFALVAVAVSDAASKANGGLIGPLDLAAVNDTVRELLAGVEVGEVGEPIRTAVGYQVLKLEARSDPEPRPYEEVRDEIGNNVFSDRRLREYLDFLDRLRSAALIEWKDESLREAFEGYEAVRAQQITAGGQ